MMKFTVKNRFFAAWRLLFLSALLSLVPTVVSAQPQDPEAPQFIDGFPDVPLLSSVMSLLGEPVVFDTPAGTVAEASLALTEPYERVVSQYGAALTSLGWGCEGLGGSLKCRREDSQLTVSSGSGTQGVPTMLLRLEPL